MSQRGAENKKKAQTFNPTDTGFVFICQRPGIVKPSTLFLCADNIHCGCHAVSEQATHEQPPKNVCCPTRRPALPRPLHCYPRVKLDATVAHTAAAKRPRSS